MQAQVESAKMQVEGARRSSKEDLERGWDKVGPAEAALRNAERALQLAKDQLNRTS